MNDYNMSTQNITNVYKSHGVYTREIDISDYDFERRRKLSKILDKIKGVEHKYIESDIEYFYRKFSESSGIPKKYFN